MQEEEKKRLDQQIKAAGETKKAVKHLIAIPDYDTRVRHACKEVADSVVAICADGNCECFTQEQVKVLSQIITHVVVMYEPALQPSDQFFVKLHIEFKNAKAWVRLGFLAIIVALITGVGTIGTAIFKTGKSMLLPQSHAAEPVSNSTEKTRPSELKSLNSEIGRTDSRSNPGIKRLKLKS